MSEQIAADPMRRQDAAPASPLSPTCPLCHTLDDTVTADSLRAGAEWTCKRCGQRWDAAQLATAAAYERYQSTH